MRVYVAGVGLAGPGLAGWQASMPVLRAEAPYQHAPTAVAASELLPAAERRRTGVPVKLALAVGSEALLNSGCDPAATATVFASSSGDCDNLHQICEALASAGREVSPTRFHNSVHNAAAGYWSIAARSREPSTSLCGHDGSFGVGLLEAAVQAAVGGRAVALIAYDHAYPEPLHAVRPIAASFGAALVLLPAPGSRCMAALEVEFVANGGGAAAMADAALEAVRAGIPAARSLPLLAALARGGAHELALECGGGAHLALGVAPCA